MGRYAWRRKVTGEQARRTTEAWYEEFGGQLFGYVALLVSNAEDAEEIVHDVFVEAYSRLLEGAHVDAPGSYLYQAARNRAYSRLRKRRLFSLFQQVRHPSQDLLHARNGRVPEDRVQLEEALAALPVKQREAVAMKVLQGYTFAEIARLLGISPNTAASRYRYGIEKLRSLLNVDEENPAR